MSTLTISGPGFWRSDQAHRCMFDQTGSCHDCAPRYESSLEHSSIHERYLENDPLFPGEFVLA